MAEPTAQEGAAPAPAPAQDWVKPRTDLPVPEGMADEDYQELMDELAEMPPPMWRTEDGVLHMSHVPAEFAPADMSVSGSVTLQPGAPQYSRYVSHLSPFYDFLGPEEVSEAPAEPEAPDTPEEPVDA